MLRTRLIHPELLRALGGAGHGARVLIADGNYPVSTMSPATAARVYLNLSPGVVSVTDVLHALVASIPIEAAHVMMPADGPEPAIFQDFRRILGDAVTGLRESRIALAALSRQGFYDAASGSDVAVAIATGDGRLYANLLLTIGVVSGA